MSETKEKAKKKGLNPLIIVIAVLVLVIIGLAAYFLVLKKPATQEASPYVAAPVVKVTEATWAAGEFLVNLADTDSDRYLKTTIVLAYDSTDTAISATLDEEKPAVRDAIIRVLSAKHSADVKSSKGMDIMKQDIIKKVNGYLESNKIVNVYFSDVLIQ